MIVSFVNERGQVEKMRYVKSIWFERDHSKMNISNGNTITVDVKDVLNIKETEHNE